MIGFFVMDDEHGEDDALWAYVTRDLEPTEREKGLLEGEKLDKKRFKVLKASEIYDYDVILPQKPDLDTVQGTEIDRRTSEKLRKGQLRIEARLDLHGMRKIEAQQRLQVFIQQAYASGKRCVLVITGKGAGADGRRDPLNSGYGVIKQSLPLWLGEGDLRGIVLKHVQAQGRDGGSGAYYVLLRRRR